jgi:hypothetical protein
MELATKLYLTIIHLTSVILFVSPRISDDPYAFALRMTSVAAPFVRATFVLPMLSASTYYVLVEFSLAVFSIGFFALEYSELHVAPIQVRTNNSLV